MPILTQQPSISCEIRPSGVDLTIDSDSECATGSTNSDAQLESSRIQGTESAFNSLGDSSELDMFMPLAERIKRRQQL